MKKQPDPIVEWSSAAMNFAWTRCTTDDRKGYSGASCLRPCATGLLSIPLTPDSMKLLILGATGNMGQRLLVQGLARGHAITAFVRNRAKLAAATGHRRAARPGGLQGRRE
jgi:hypothetical protein